MARLASFATQLGEIGEYLIWKELKSFERKGGRFLFNLYIPKANDETTEIDVVLIHPKGFFVIESKNYNGWIFGNERNPTRVSQVDEDAGGLIRKAPLTGGMPEG